MGYKALSLDAPSKNRKNLIAAGTNLFRQLLGFQCTRNLFKFY